MSKRLLKKVNKARDRNKMGQDNLYAAMLNVVRIIRNKTDYDDLPDKQRNNYLNNVLDEQSKLYKISKDELRETLRYSLLYKISKDELRKTLLHSLTGVPLK